MDFIIRLGVIIICHNPANRTGQKYSGRRIKIYNKQQKTKKKQTRHYIDKIGNKRLRLAYDNMWIIR